MSSLAARGLRTILREGSQHNRPIRRPRLWQCEAADDLALAIKLDGTGGPLRRGGLPAPQITVVAGVCSTAC
jgi:hypothetical protein